MVVVIFLQLALLFGLIRYLFKRDKGTREPFFPVVYALLLGVVAVIIAGTINTIVLPIFGLPAPGQSAAAVPLIALILACLSIGVTEELAKALPLKRFIYNKGYFNEVGDGIIYFGLAGAVFGAIENIYYALMLGPEVGLNRIITVPFMHAGFSSIIGYALARQKVLGRPAWTATFGFLIAIFLHAFYDFGLFYAQPWSLYASMGLIVVVNLLIFILYKRARTTDARHVPRPITPSAR